MCRSHSKPVIEEKDDLLPVSKDCLQQGATPEEEEKEEEDVLCSQNTISFNIVAHSGLIEEVFSGQVYLLFFYTLTVRLCFRVPTCTPQSYWAIHQRLLVFILRGNKWLHVVQRFAYLFRLTCWMLLQTPSPPLKHSAKSSHLPLNHQAGPMLSWPLSAISIFFILL